ncbi:MAG: carboxypeptidase regulatory-like domain-containing protein [Nannocystaceae bacterium]
MTATAGDGGFNRAAAFTDGAGRFRLGGLEPGVYKAEAAADELFGRADEQVVLGLGETSAPLVITAHPAFSIRGVVVIDGGDVCDLGTVSLLERSANRMSHASIERDGSVHHPALLPGEYEVTVRCAGQVAAERYDPVPLVDRSLEGLRWSVSPGSAIRGQIVDARGAGVPGMIVQVRRKLDPAIARSRELNAMSQETGSDGRFEVAGLLGGDYDVVPSSGSSRRAGPKPLVVTVPEGGDVDDLKLEAPATGEARGRVVDADGRPLAGVTVLLGGLPQNTTGSTADDGTFVLRDVAAGTYRATVRVNFGEILRAPGVGDDDVQGEPVEIEVDAITQVDLVVESASGVLTGVVQDEDGGPVADAFVEAVRESERAGAAASAAVRDSRWGSLLGARDPILSDADGRFTASRLTAGKYTLLAHRKGGGEAILEHVAPGSDVVLTIASTGRMSGTVALAGGGAPDEFTILIRDPRSGFSRTDTFFRSEGAWSLPEIPAGEYTVTVTCGAGTARIDATMIAGEDVEGLRIELAPRVTARGTLVDDEGAPVAGMEVTIWDGGGGYTYGGLARAHERNVTGDDGRFEVAEAPAGRVTLNVRARANDAFEWASVPITLSADAPVAELPPIPLVRRRVAPSERPGAFGFALQDPDPTVDARDRRFIVARVRPGGAAARAGLRVGDEIVRVDGKDIRGARSYLYPLLLGVPVGATITLGLARDVDVDMIAESSP